ncbi:MAG: hypothetical protein ACRD3T_22755, partial [Terriglobia bacterium]
GTTPPHSDGMKSQLLVNTPFHPGDRGSWANRLEKQSAITAPNKRWVWMSSLVKAECRRL